LYVYSVVQRGKLCMQFSVQLRFWFHLEPVHTLDERLHDNEILWYERYCRLGVDHQTRTGGRLHGADSLRRRRSLMDVWKGHYPKPLDSGYGSSDVHQFIPDTVLSLWRLQECKDKALYLIHAVQKLGSLCHVRLLQTQFPHVSGPG